MDLVLLDLAGMPLVPRFQLLGHGDPSSSNDRDLYSTAEGYRYMKGRLGRVESRCITGLISLDFMDEQNSPQAMGIIQHQAPDTTSPSPPHPYTTNGSFPSSMHPQGNIQQVIYSWKLFS